MISKSTIFLTSLTSKWCQMVWMMSKSSICHGAYGVNWCQNWHHLASFWCQKWCMVSKMVLNDVKWCQKDVKDVKKWCLWCQNCQKMVFMVSNDDKKEPFFDIFDLKMVLNSVKDVQNGAYGVKWCEMM